ncbi:MAG: SEC-C metal-binding domain-containing protein, partial [Alphaproteobacteria bacterium]|nr:SEC-C metal-binding domain-containing protein [Alphaproteobacteria bacterium]
EFPSPGRAQAGPDVEHTPGGGGCPAATAWHHSHDFLTDYERAVLLCRSIYILADACDRRTYHPFLRLLQKPETRAEHPLAPLFTDLPNIIIRIFDWDAAPLSSIIADRSVHPGIRCGLLDATAFLTFHGKIARDRTVDFLSGFDATGETVIECWIFAIGLLGLRELTPLVARRVAVADFEDLVDFCDNDGAGGTLSSLLKDAAAAPNDEGRFHEQNIGELGKLVETLSDHPDPRLATRPRQPKPAAPPPGPAPRKPAQQQTPQTNPFRNVGRNDPCPCGSGLKAKKCCLGNK